MARKLNNVSMFVVGDPSLSFPGKIFFSYDVKAGKASKKNNIFEIDDPDPSVTANQIWGDALVQIKQNENIE